MTQPSIEPQNSDVKIYTKTGDKGQTKLVDGSTVEKSNPRVEAYGTVDELNSQLGFVRCLLSGHAAGAKLDPWLERIQNELFNVGSLLACADEKALARLPALSTDSTALLEKEIDELTADLPELRNFILPGGVEGAAALHLARTICRRAERRSTDIPALHDTDRACLQYLNRLSDFFFVAARWVNWKSGLADVAWKKG